MLGTSIVILQLLLAKQTFHSTMQFPTSAPVTLPDDSVLLVKAGTCQEDYLKLSGYRVWLDEGKTEGPRLILLLSQEFWAGSNWVADEGKVSCFSKT